MKTKLLIVFLFFAINSSIFAQLEEAVDFTIVDTKNDTFQLFKLLDSGYFVLMDCGAGWCGWCRLSIPALKSYWNKYHSNKGCFTILSLYVDQRETTGSVKSFIAHDAIPYPVFAMDSNYYQLDDICWQYSANTGIPQFILINPDRTIPYLRIGGLIDSSANNLDSIIGSYMQEAVCYNLNIDDIKTVNSKVKINPNPFHNNMNIEFEIESNADIQYAIYDNTGKEVEFGKRKHLMKGLYHKQINTEFYKEGLYFFVVNINGQIQSSKIIKL